MIIRIFLVFLLTSFAQAAGTIQVDGKVRSFSKDHVAIQSNDTIYFIEKKQLTENQKKAVQEAKVDSPLTLTVNFKAIGKVETVEK